MFGNTNHIEVETQNKGNDFYCKLGNTIQDLQNALQKIMDNCDPENESHAGFYFYAKEALEKSKENI